MVGLSSLISVGKAGLDKLCLLKRHLRNTFSTIAVLVNKTNAD